MPADQTIDLSTFGGALRHGFRIVAHCAPCRTHLELDLKRYPPDQVFVGKRFRCTRCGAVGSISVSQILTGGDGHSPALDRWRKNNSCKT